ncbi:MAG: sulfotransferase domain-containing protein [Verrucomicrobia bacterium]|nr:sulfotransferase domain-containing protein [Verrucomicrobiota bacterium]
MTDPKSLNQWIYIAGLPKSGTTWLKQLLERIPGYQFVEPPDPTGVRENHDISSEMFASLPREVPLVMKMHTSPAKQNLAVIRHYGLRTIVMYRDLRDQCISNYYHVLADGGHRHHRLYHSIPAELGITHRIAITLDAYMPWIRGWINVLRQFPDDFMEVRYEALKTDPEGVLERISSFYHLNLSTEFCRSIVQEVQSRTRFDLKYNLERGTGTARKGKVGDWRAHFNSDHVKLFKAGCGDLLIELGYEKDLNW